MDLRKKIELTAKMYFGTARFKEKRKLFQDESSRQMMRMQWDNPEEVMSEYEAGDKNEVYKRISRQIAQQKPKRLQLFINKYAAAISLLLLIAGVASFIFLFDVSGNYTAKTIKKACPKGEQLNFFLPDGSQVFLNADSQIEFPEFFGEDKRIVKLKGEAFFRIKHNPDKAFIVKTASIDAEVLGTEFNLQAYSDMPMTETTLSSGKLKLTRRHPESGKQQSLILSPGHKANFYKKEEKFIADTVNTQLYTSWIHGKLIFDNKPLSRIIPILERKYDTRIQIDSVLSEKHRFTMTITTESMNDIIQLMEKTANLNFIQKNNTLYIKEK